MNPLIRQWRVYRTSSQFQAHSQSHLLQSSFTLPFRIMSYNILAQNLLLRHQYLYKYSPPFTLAWEHRLKLILEQISALNPDIICLQEVRWPDIEKDFAPFFSERGYAWCYHRKPPNTPLEHEDGVAFIYRQSQFELLQWRALDFNVNEILNRDNVGLLAHLKVKGSTYTFFVATTHLLYNPKAEEIRLGQMHYLLTHLVHFMNSNEHAPILLCGDFNSEPLHDLPFFLLHGHCEVPLFLPTPSSSSVSRRFTSVHLDHPFHWTSLYPMQPYLITSATSVDSHYVDYIYFGYLKKMKWKSVPLGSLSCPPSLLVTSTTHMDEDTSKSAMEDTLSSLPYSPQPFVYEPPSSLHSTPRPFFLPQRYLELPKRKFIVPPPNETEGSDHFPLLGDFLFCCKQESLSSSFSYSYSSYSSYSSSSSMASSFSSSSSFER